MAYQINRSLIFVATVLLAPSFSVRLATNASQSKSTDSELCDFNGGRGQIYLSIWPNGAYMTGLQLWLGYSLQNSCWHSVFLFVWFFSSIKNSSCQTEHTYSRWQEGAFWSISTSCIGAKNKISLCHTHIQTIPDTFYGRQGQDKGEQARILRPPTDRSKQGGDGGRQMELWKLPQANPQKMASELRFKAGLLGPRPVYSKLVDVA